MTLHAVDPVSEMIKRALKEQAEKEQAAATPVPPQATPSQPPLAPEVAEGQYPKETIQTPTVKKPDEPYQKLAPYDPTLARKRRQAYNQMAMPQHQVPVFGRHPKYYPPGAIPLEEEVAPTPLQLQDLGNIASQPHPQQNPGESTQLPPFEVLHP